MGSMAIGVGRSRQGSLLVGLSKYGLFAAVDW